VPPMGAPPLHLPTGNRHGVALQHGVKSDLKLVPNARRSECVITLQKAAKGEWWRARVDL
jgi:hypothetical protein